MGRAKASAVEHGNARDRSHVIGLVGFSCLCLNLVRTFFGAVGSTTLRYARPLQICLLLAVEPSRALREPGAAYPHDCRS